MGQSTYESSDPWLLLSIIHAARTGQANIERIIEVGDGINFAIFTDEELNGGLSRLMAGGLVSKQDGIYYPSQAAIEAHSKKLTPRRSLYKQLEDLEEFLKSA